MHKVKQKQELKSSGGFISGRGIVRDKDGNIKGHITFDGFTPLSKEQVEEKLNVPVEETSSGTDTPDSST